MFFEGSEKKVEIVVSSTLPSLRSQGDAVWARVVEKACATILSTVRNEHCDAYLLSESSLFVYDHSLVMITCGTTSLISAIEDVLSFIPRDDIRLVMYERKNEQLPEAQPSDFDADAARLEEILPGGESYVFGEPFGNHIRLFHFAQNHSPAGDDITLEILMHGLSPRARNLFCRSDLTREILYQETGIHRIFKDFQVDDFLFDPMGYSLNAIGGREYYTFHITPQEECSYASFETNHVFGDDFHKTVAKVLNIFEPDHFSQLLFHTSNPTMAAPRSYRLNQEVSRHCRGYRIRFGHFRRTADTNEPG